MAEPQDDCSKNKGALKPAPNPNAQTIAPQEFPKAPMAANPIALQLLPRQPANIQNLLNAEVEACLQEGQRFLEDGQFEQALACYDLALSLKPEEAQIWSQRGDTLNYLGHLEEAVASYNQALTYSNASAASESLTQTLDHLDTPNGESSLELDGEVTGSLEGEELAVALCQLGQYETAILIYDELLIANAEQTHLWYGRGNALHRCGRYEAAIASYDRALALDPQHPAAWFDRGCALDELGQYEMAVASYDQALALQPQYQENWRDRGDMLYELGRYEAAITSYDRALENQIADSHCWYGRGNALNRLGRYAEAIACYDQSLTLHPDKHEAWYQKARASMAQGQRSQVLTCLQRTLRLSPNQYRELINADLIFNPLRNTAEFQQLLSDLTTPNG